MSDIACVVSGIGLASGYGYGKAATVAGRAGGRPVFDRLRRPGRQVEGIEPFLGVELPDAPPEVLPRRVARTTGLTGLVLAAVLAEAWDEAGLDRVAAERIGLVIGGSNLQSREHYLIQQKHAGERLLTLPPRQGHQFFDTDLAGLLASEFPIRGFARTVGGASASGAVAVQMAAEAVRAGQVDACIAIGALQDLSVVELHALRSLGAMGSERFAEAPGLACRPFDRDRDGFLFGESAAALVVARADLGLGTLGRLLGWAQVADGTRGPNPSAEGEARAIARALEAAGLSADQIDLVGAHGTGTPLGDDTEAAVLNQAGLARAAITAPKSALGHGIAAAGAVEIALALLQMAEGRAWPIRNLETPIEPALNLVAGTAVERPMRHALTLSFGFGGIDTATVLGVPE